MFSKDQVRRVYLFRSIFLSFLILLINPYSVAGQKSSTKTMYFIFGGRKVPVHLNTFKGYEVNSICQKLGSQCQAIKHVKKSSKVAKSQSAWDQTTYGNPAHQHCREVGGVYAVLKGASAEETGYCGFKDKSMIDAWQLYQGAKS